MGIKLTEEQKVHYLTVYEGDRCPFCGYRYLNTEEHPVQVSPFEVSLDVSCPDCKHKWRDTYRLHDVEDIEEEEEEDDDTG